MWIDPNATPQPATPPAASTPLTAEQTQIAELQKQVTQLTEDKGRLAGSISTKDKAISELQTKLTEIAKNNDTDGLSKEIKKLNAIIEANEKNAQTALDNAIKQIPAEKQSLVPQSLSTYDKLAYIEANRQHLVVDAKQPKANIPAANPSNHAAADVFIVPSFKTINAMTPKDREESRLAHRAAAAAGKKIITEQSNIANKSPAG